MEESGTLMSDTDTPVVLFFIILAILMGFVAGCTANKGIQYWDIVKLDGQECVLVYGEGNEVQKFCKVE